MDSVFWFFFSPSPVSFLLLSTVFPLKFLVDQLGLMRMDSLNRCVKVYFSSSFLKGSLPGVEFWSMLLYFLRLKMLFPHLPSDLSQKVFLFFYSYLYSFIMGRFSLHCFQRFSVLSSSSPSNIIHLDVCGFGGKEAICPVLCSPSFLVLSVTLGTCSAIISLDFFLLRISYLFCFWDSRDIRVRSPDSLPTRLGRSVCSFQSFCPLFPCFRRFPRAY